MNELLSPPPTHQYINISERFEYGKVFFEYDSWRDNRIFYIVLWPAVLNVGAAVWLHPTSNQLFHTISVRDVENNHFV
jgi:hypothetical protein